MKKAIVAAFAALALIGCVNPSDKAEKAAAPPPQPVQTVSVPPALQPVTVADIDACKDAWIENWAKEHHTTVAAAERHARRMPATTLSWTYAGKTVTFTKTVWHSCEAAIKKSRATPAQTRTAVQDSASAALIADLRAQNQRLTAENHRLKGLAYQNPLETDPAKLISNQARVTELEMRLADAERPITLTTIIVASLFGLVCLVLGLYIGAKRWRRRSVKQRGLKSP